uniref:Variant surface glycoprotein 1567 n=1 Tax=Trypanosoma brucei TaxID=5691 RepID=M4SYR8_9TRYP
MTFFSLIFDYFYRISPMYIQIILTKRLDQIQTKRHELLEITFNIISKLENLSGHQSAVAELSDIKVKGLNMGNGDPNSSRNDQTNINFQSKTSSGLTNCHKALEAKANHFASWVRTTKLDSLKRFTVTITPDNTAAVRAAAVEKNNSAACAKSGVTGTVATSSDNACIIDSPVTAEEAITLYKGSGDFGLAEKAVTYSGNFKQFAQKTAIDLLEVAASWEKTSMTFDAGKISSCASDDDFRAAVGATWTGLSREAALGEKTKAVTQLISSTYGDYSTFSNRYWDKLTQIKLPTTLLGEKRTQTIKEVKTMDEASKMLLQALLEVTTKNQANPSCHTKTDKAIDKPKLADECKKANNRGTTQG